MAKTVVFIVSMLVIMAFAVAASRADYRAALTAYNAGDYDEAYSKLTVQEVNKDPEAIKLMSDMKRLGRGTPKNLVEAYKLLSMIIIAGNDDQRDEAIAMRGMLARTMSAAEIRVGEDQTIAWVTENMGPGALAAEISRLKQDLSGCSWKKDCREASMRILKLGPAAHELIPLLEADLTRDPHWVGREWHADALAMIGTAAVPALSRVLLDIDTIESEGTYSAMQAAQALGLIGPTARDALPSLMTALARRYSKLGSEGTEIAGMLGASERHLVWVLKASIGRAIISVGDPDNAIRANLLSYVQSETEMVPRLMAASAIGVMYRDTKPGLEAIGSALNNPDKEIQQLALYAFRDFTLVPGFDEDSAPLLPRMHELERSSDSEISEFAKKAMAGFSNAPLRAAIHMFRKTHFELSEQIADAIVARQPANSMAYLVRGSARREQGKLEEAIEDYAKVIDLGESDFLRKIVDGAGFGPSNSNEGLRAGMARCIRDNACFRTLEQALEPRFTEIFKSAGG